MSGVIPCKPLKTGIENYLQFSVSCIGFNMNLLWSSSRGTPWCTSAYSDPNQLGSGWFLGSCSRSVSVVAEKLMSWSQVWCNLFYTMCIFKSTWCMWVLLLLNWERDNCAQRQLWFPSSVTLNSQQVQLPPLLTFHPPSCHRPSLPGYPITSRDQKSSSKFITLPRLMRYCSIHDSIQPIRTSWLLSILDSSFAMTIIRTFSHSEHLIHWRFQTLQFEAFYWELFCHQMRWEEVGIAAKINGEVSLGNATSPGIPTFLCVCLKKSSE